MTDFGGVLVTALDGHKSGPIVTVPGSGLAAFYDRYREPECRYATREEEAIALASGLVLAGCEPTVVIPQAGVGNTLNAVFTLADAYHLSFPIVVCDRGQRDDNPAQRVSSRSTATVMRALGATFIDIDSSAAVDAVRAALSARRRWVVIGAGQDQSTTDPIGNGRAIR